MGLLEVRSRRERVGVSNGSYGGRELTEFNQFIEDIELLDISLIGRSFTCYRANGRAKSQLDRILVAREWFNCWKGSSQYVLNRNISDHF